MSAIRDVDGRSGYQDHRDRGRPGVGLDLAADVEAAHVRPVHVDQHQVGGDYRGERFAPVPTSVTVCPARRSQVPSA
jgi:hypothetical protein